jgi:iron complex outermembrane receptor protein
MSIYYIRRFIPGITCLAFLLFSFQTGFGQQATGSIRGTITTADGQPVAFSTIILKGTSKGATTDQQGVFQIQRLAPGAYTLHVKHIGLLPQNKQVTLAAGQQQTVDFTLEKDVTSLQEIQVTSGYNKFARKETGDMAKLPLKNLENPQVYNVVPKELLQDQLIVSYNDVLKNVVGVSQGLVNGSNSFNLRGFSTSSYLRNGLQQVISNSIEVANIERIEVLKGPSATLFGSTLTSFGGMLNRITKKPFEIFKGEASYTLGGFGLSRITADFNTPLSKEKGLFLRTNVAYHDEGSFQDAGFTKRFLFAPSLLYKVNDRLTLSMDAEVYSQKANDFNRLFPEASFTKKTPRDLGIDYRKSYSTDDLYQTEPSVSIFAEANYKISDQWTSKTSLSHTNDQVQGILGWNEIYRDSIVYRNFQHQNSFNNYTEVQQNFNGDFHIGSLRNRIVVGLDYFTHQAKSSTSTLYAYDNVLIHGKDPRYSSLTKTALDLAFASEGYSRSTAGESIYSAYFSDVLNLTDNLMVMASLRVDHFVNEGVHDINKDTVADKYSQTALSPKLGMVYELVKDKVSLFGNYMNGFSNNSPALQTNGQYGSFKPSQANQWETGVKLDLFNGKLNSTLSYYHIKVTDMVRRDFKNSNYSVQDGGQMSKGFEAEVIANPLPGFNLIAGYAYNDIYTINTGEDVDGLRQWTGPGQTANLWLSYHFLHTALKGLGVGIGGNYNDRAYIVQSRQNGEFYMPAYTVLNATLSYDQPVYRVTLKMDNLTNEVYWGSYISQMMPGRFSASVALKFQ